MTKQLSEAIDQSGHASYALKKVRQVAEAILADKNATSNERALASCVIAINRSLLPSWTIL